MVAPEADAEAVAESHRRRHGPCPARWLERNGRPPPIRSATSFLWDEGAEVLWNYARCVDPRRSRDDLPRRMGGKRVASATRRFIAQGSRLRHGLGPGGTGCLPHDVLRRR